MFDTYPPITLLRQRKCVSDSEVTRETGAKGLNNPWRHGEWSVNWRRFVVKLARCTPCERATTGYRSWNIFPHERKDPVVNPVEASLVGY